MPSRIIKQSICTSESMASLSWFEQILFIRLIVSADDFGRYDARPAIIRGALFPLDDGVTVKAIRDALNKLSTQGMVNLYEVGGRPTLELTAWRKHNKPRAKESKYPGPSEDSRQMQTHENKCKQMQADAPVIRNSNSEFDIRNSGSGYAPAPKDGDLFTAFWNAYPETARRRREAAWNAWKKLNPNREAAERIMECLDAWKRSKRWMDDNGEFIPNAANFLDPGKGYLDTKPAPGKQPIPKGASGEPGEAELEAIRRVLAQPADDFQDC